MDCENTEVNYLLEHVVDYYPYGKVLREHTNCEDARYLTTHHERDKETGLDYRGARFYDSDIGRFLSLDPLAMEFPQWSDYNYVLGNPIYFTDPDGRFPIPESFRSLYPQLTNFIENRLQNYITGSERMSAALLKYSGGNLTSEQIALDFSNDGGPALEAYNYEDYGGTLDQGGEYVYATKTIRFSTKKLERFENLLNNPKPEIQQWGMMEGK